MVPWLTLFGSRKLISELGLETGFWEITPRVLGHIFFKPQEDLSGPSLVTRPRAEMSFEFK